MIQPVLPEVDSLLQSPSHDEAKNAIKIVSTHASPFEELSMRTTAAMTKIRFTLAKAKVTKSNRKAVLEGTTALLAILYEQANAIGTLSSKASLLEAKCSEVDNLREQIGSLKGENARLTAEKAAADQRASQSAAPVLQSSTAQEAPSYANALKRVPPHKRKAKNVSLVFAKSKDTSSEEVKETLLKALAPSKIKIGIKNVKKLAKGGVAIECDTAKGTETILKEINSNQQLSNAFEAKAPTKRLPRVVIYDVDEAVSKEDFIGTLANQNEGLREQDFPSCFKLKSKQSGKCHWVIEVQPKTFHSLLRRKKVFFEWNRLSLREFIRPTRCYKCNRFGHISTNCQQAESCPQCGEEGHKKAECTNEAKCINCTEANNKYKLNHDTTHAATDPSCPALAHETDQLISRTNYGR
ncbi:hypothetical protein AVEN_125453-1 [Araneus ventricosus]|uniref:CCHC-type domain-containing protein n=1 Tax=Araneus ventricosus TaxID=182803 RepID=A0A4Y2H3W2_ARAVE|nr:hypothetical protein AVEN_125453-1 [Araneus ventricosus]